MHGHAVIPKYHFERFSDRVLDRSIRNALEAQPGRVVPQQIDVHAPFPKHFNQHSGLFHRVVYPRQQAVLDRHGPATARLESIRRLEDFLDGKAFGHRKQLCTSGIVWRMQRDGQLDVQSRGGQRVDAGDDPHGGDGDLPPTQSAQSIARNPFDCGEDRWKIEHRFTHAHEDERLKLAPDTLSLTSQREELLDDLARGQVALKTGLRRRAKIASHGATYLRGNTPRGTIRSVIGHQHRLHRFAIVKPEKEFGGPIGCDPPER
jgi:hypothetical protein